MTFSSEMKPSKCDKRNTILHEYLKKGNVEQWQGGGNDILHACRSGRSNHISLSKFTFVSVLRTYRENGAELGVGYARLSQSEEVSI